MKKILESEHLLLREMTDDDFNALKKVIKDHAGNVCDDEYIQKWIDWCKSSYEKYGFGHLAVVYKQSGEMIGSAGISMQPIDNVWRPEIGYHLREDFHRQGLGKEVAKALRDYFFNTFKNDEVYSFMNKENIPSYKTAESMGMKFQYTFFDKYGNEYKIYKITREEWNKLKEQ